MYNIEAEPTGTEPLETELMELVRKKGRHRKNRHPMGPAVEGGRRVFLCVFGPVDAAERESAAVYAGHLPPWVRVNRANCRSKLASIYIYILPVLLG